MDIMGKPAANQFFDKCLKEALQCKAEEIKPSGVLFDRINTEICYREKENISVNQYFKLKKVKPLIIVSLVLILSAATCFAASQITSLVSHSTDVFDKFPSKNQVEKAVNYIPEYTEKFSNGFYFETASIDNTQALDSEKKKVDECKGISFHYTRENAQKGQLLNLNSSPVIAGTQGELEPNQEVIKNGKLDLIYSKVTFKVVPEGYVPTKEENQKMDQGVLWVSYGSDKEEVSEIQYVTWTRDGINYNLMEQSYGLAKDELINMAKEVIGTSK
jgi:hypothetical protein